MTGYSLCQYIHETSTVRPGPIFLKPQWAFPCSSFLSSGLCLSPEMLWKSGKQDSPVSCDSQRFPLSSHRSASGRCQLPVSLIFVSTKSLIDGSIQAIDWLTWGRASLTRRDCHTSSSGTFPQPTNPWPSWSRSLNVWSSPWLLAFFLSLRTTVIHEVLHRNRFVFLDTEGQCLGKQHLYMQLNHIPFRQKTLHRKDSSFTVYSQGTGKSVISPGWLTKPFQLNASAVWEAVCLTVIYQAGLSHRTERPQCYKHTAQPINCIGQ